MSEILTGKRKVYFKIIEQLEFNFVFEKCPVQVLRGRTVSDIETGRLYLSLDFLNVGDKDITGIDFRIFFYTDGSNLPQDRQDFFYDLSSPPPEAFVADAKPEKHKTKAPKDTVFGSDYYIRLTDNYFKRLDIGINMVQYSDGSREQFHAVSRSEFGAFNALNHEELSAYKDINIYSESERLYPARFMPTRDEFTWVCCCGGKNSLEAEKCAICGRQRDWQFENLTVEHLDKVADDISNSEQAQRQKAGELRAKAISRSEFNSEAVQQREQRAKEGVERAEKQQKVSETRRKRIIAIILVWLVILAIYLAVSNVRGR